MRADVVALLSEFNGNIDAANMKANSLTGAEMAATGFPFPLRTIVERSGLLTSSIGSSAPLRRDGTVMTLGPAISTVAFLFDPADYAVSGRTPRLRVRGGIAVNGTAAGITVAVGMASFTVTAGGAGSGNAIGVLTGLAATAALTPGAAGVLVQGQTADFALPVAGYYVLYMSPSGAPAANSVLDVYGSLQVHWI